MRAATLLLALAFAASARPAILPEYQAKAAFLYNFALFTEWPAGVGNTLTLCIQGKDPFDAAVDELHGKAVGSRQIAIERRPVADSLKDCQIVFIPQSSAGALPATVARLRGSAVLTVAESPGATHQGAMLNMSVARDRITFSANMKAAQQSGLSLSSKLLRLATEVVR